MDGRLMVDDVEGAGAPQALHRGVERDLELLYRDAGPRLWRAIYGFAGGRRDVADDAVAEAFARPRQRPGRHRRLPRARRLTSCHEAPNARRAGSHRFDRGTCTPAP